MQRDGSNEYTATPLEDNLFEWHFTIRGPVDTEFQGGIYHGRIILPAEYPFKPPSISFMTVRIAHRSRLNDSLMDGLKLAKRFVCP
jgi:ubiquitin-protein ligase